MSERLPAEMQQVLDRAGLQIDDQDAELLKAAAARMAMTVERLRTHLAVTTEPAGVFRPEVRQ